MILEPGQSESGATHSGPSLWVLVEKRSELQAASLLSMWILSFETFLRASPSLNFFTNIPCCKGTTMHVNPRKHANLPK